MRLRRGTSGDGDGDGMGMVMLSALAMAVCIGLHWRTTKHGIASGKAGSEINTQLLSESTRDQRARAEAKVLPNHYLTTVTGKVFQYKLLTDFL